MDKLDWQWRIADWVLDLIYGSYLEAAPRLSGLDARTRDVSVTQRLFDELGARFPWPSVAVAGSKGKGSTAAMLASILAAGGERVGLLTSPHQRRFTERIRVDGKSVSERDLEKAAGEIRSAVLSLRKRIPPPRYLGPGGVILAMAAGIFREARISVLVVEAGRGGEHDEVSLVKPRVSVLTPIMLEHPDKLGGTVWEIAATKTRIAPAGSPIISARQTPEAEAAIRGVAEELGSPVHWVHRETSVSEVRSDLDGVTFDLRVGDESYPDLSAGLAGSHQAENTAAAVLAARVLQDGKSSPVRDAIYRGAQRVRWPGRIHVLQTQPLVILDAAISGGSASQVCEVIQHHAGGKLIGVVAVPRPKDLEGVYREVSRVARTIITTEVRAPGLEGRWDPAAPEIAARFCGDVRHVVPLRRAFDYALAQAEPSGAVFLTGTQAFVGAALERWDAETERIW